MLLQSRKDNAAGLLRDAANALFQTEMMGNNNGGGAAAA